jgi:hypothetical protein
VFISEYAVFDECFFMHQRHSAPQLHPPHPEYLLELPSHPEPLPDVLDSVSDDSDTLKLSQMPFHGRDASTASDQSSVLSEIPAVLLYRSRGALESQRTKGTAEEEIRTKGLISVQLQIKQT